jgi:hypothetical protein
LSSLGVAKMTRIITPMQMKMLNEQIIKFLDDHVSLLKQKYTCCMICADVEYTCKQLRDQGWKVYRGTNHRIYVAIATIENGGFEKEN